jgi:hypothetical protein
VQASSRLTLLTSEAAYTSELITGTGKSVLLKEIIKAMRKKHVKTIDAVAITASTGMQTWQLLCVTHTDTLFQVLLPATSEV